MALSKSSSWMMSGGKYFGLDLDGWGGGWGVVGYGLAAWEIALREEGSLSFIFSWVGISFGGVGILYLFLSCAVF
jgi:hypothetical protein